MNKILAIIAFLFVFIPLATNATEVTFMWDANDPVPEGYRLFIHSIGADYNYAEPIWQGSEITATVDIPEGIEHYAVVRAFEGDLESGNSNEVVFTIESEPEVLYCPKRPKTLIIQFD